MKPPTPQEWLESLPLFTEGEEGCGIYTGIVNDIENVVVFVHDGNTLSVASFNSPEIGQAVYYYDEEDDEFKLTPLSVGTWASAIIQNTGYDLVVGSSIITQDVVKSMIMFKMVDAQP